MLEKVEKVKEELIETIKDPKYIDKLIKELNCSKEEALKHQAVRIKNMETVNYNFCSIEELILGKNALADYLLYSHLINLPYNVDDDT